MELGTGKCKPCQKFYAGSMTIQSSSCTHCGELWRENFNRDISYEWDGKQVSDYNPWTKFVAWELCKDDLEEIFPKPKPVVVKPKPEPVKPDPKPTNPENNKDDTCTAKSCLDKPSKPDTNEKQSSSAKPSTPIVVQEEEDKVKIPQIDLEVTKTGSYLIYGGIILFVLLCCCCFIVVLTCVN